MTAPRKPETPELRLARYHREYRDRELSLLFFALALLAVASLLLA